MDRIEAPKGYVVQDRRSVEKILATEAELLWSEGIDPAWPGFPEHKPRDDDE